MARQIQKDKKKLQPNNKKVEKAKVIEKKNEKNVKNSKSGFNNKNQGLVQKNIEETIKEIKKQKADDIKNKKNQNLISILQPDNLAQDLIQNLKVCKNKKELKEINEKYVNIVLENFLQAKENKKPLNQKTLKNFQQFLKLFFEEFVLIQNEIKTKAQYFIQFISSLQIKIIYEFQSQLQNQKDKRPICDLFNEFLFTNLTKKIAIPYLVQNMKQIYLSYIKWAQELVKQKIDRVQFSSIVFEFFDMHYNKLAQYVAKIRDTTLTKCYSEINDYFLELSQKQFLQDNYYLFETYQDILKDIIKEQLQLPKNLKTLFVKIVKQLNDIYNDIQQKQLEEDEEEEEEEEEEDEDIDDEKRNKYLSKKVRVKIPQYKKTGSVKGADKQITSLYGINLDEDEEDDESFEEENEEQEEDEDLEEGDENNNEQQMVDDEDEEGEEQEYIEDLQNGELDDQYDDYIYSQEDIQDQQQEIDNAIKLVLSLEFDDMQDEPSDEIDIEGMDFSKVMNKKQMKKKLDDYLNRIPKHMQMEGKQKDQYFKKFSNDFKKKLQAEKNTLIHTHNKKVIFNDQNIEYKDFHKENGLDEIKKQVIKYPFRKIKPVKKQQQKKQKNQKEVKNNKKINNANKNKNKKQEQKKQKQIKKK